MQPDSAVLAGASTVQMLGFALGMIMLLFVGYKVMTGGAKGFAFAMESLAGLLAAAYILARPNDIMNTLAHWVGGIQAPALPH